MNPVAKAYTQGLYALARDEKVADTLLHQLQILREAFAELPTFCRLLAIPALSKQERIGIVEQSFQGIVHPYVLNFLKLLTEQGCVDLFCQCCDFFQQYYHRDNDLLPVRVVTASALTEEQSVRLAEKMTVLTGKTVLLTSCIDPACLGGIRLEYGDKCIDGTVKHRLDSMTAVLKNTC